MMWEIKDSNLCAYDLQSLLAAPAYFPCADGGIRTRTIQILSLTRIPFPSHLRSPGGSRTLKSPDPKSGAFTSLTTEPNKKASQLREACKSLKAKRYPPVPVGGKYKRYNRAAFISQI